MYKLLHIGKKGNVEKYTPKEFYEKFELIDVPMNMPVREILAVGGDADFIVADAIGRLTGELIDNMPRLKLIHSEGVAYNSFDTAAASRNGVYVCNCKGMNDMAVAEQTVLLILGLLRDLKGGDQAVREGRQIIKKENYMTEGNLYEIGDFNIGLVGFGDIAKKTALLMNAFGAKVFYYDIVRASADTEKAYNVFYRPLTELLGTCGIISVHLPVTPDTENMADDSFFDKMQDGSYFINTSRGEIVDSAALIRAMEKGKVYKAGLDTIAGEPVMADNILLCQNSDIENRILFSPHIAGITASSFRRGYAMIVENIERIISGEKPLRVVN